METTLPEATEKIETPDLKDIKHKMHFSGSVLKTTLAGAVVDIGLGIPGVVHISQLQAEPVNRVEDVVRVGQTVEVWVRRVDVKKKRIDLTMIKPLDLEWREIDKDMVLKGKVVRMEKFGAFIDIGAERPGLVHISEMAHAYVKSPSEVVKEGDEVEVKVLNVDRRKKQIKLSMKATEEPPAKIVKEIQQPVSKSTIETEPKEEAIPTAMEMAMRSAVERSKVHHSQSNRVKTISKPKAHKDELETIMARTLKHKRK
jgi:small subunit ribosomal protein S1